MRKRWIFLTVAAVALVVLTAGIAFAAGRGTQPNPTQQESGQACDAMHDSPAMRQMHERMPAALQAQCDAMHEQVDQMMGASGGSGMMGGSGDSGMMGGSGMMGDQSMAGHHASTQRGE
jgi:hypothetical protein